MYFGERGTVKEMESSALSTPNLIPRPKNRAHRRLCVRARRGPFAAPLFRGKATSFRARNFGAAPSRDGTSIQREARPCT